MNKTAYIRILLFWLAASVLAAAASCSSQVSPPEANEEPPTDTIGLLVNQLQSCDRLYTTEYVVKKIVTYDDVVKIKGTVFSQKFDFRLPQGSRKILIPMEANVKAYIDFADFTDADIVRTSDSTIHVSLPDPRIEVTATKIDHHGVKAFIDFGRSSFSHAEMADFERQGRASIVASIPAMGIADKAREHAYQALLPMFEAMGYVPEHVTMDFGKQYSDSDYANTIVVMGDNH